MIVILGCFFIILLYLYGDVYALCGSNYPDKIVDLQYSIFLFRAEYEQADCFELKYDKQLTDDDEIQISSICNVSTIMSPFFLESVYSKDSKKRLTILHRYNS